MKKFFIKGIFYSDNKTFITSFKAKDKTEVIKKFKENFSNTAFIVEIYDNTINWPTNID